MTFQQYQRFGSQRDWIWRGWQTRYTYIRSANPHRTTLPLILLHGFGTSIGHWRHNLGALSEHHTVYALDLLGFGASEKAPARYNVDIWVEQVYEFWRTFIRQPVVLVGNSIGSLIALAAVAAHPDMVQGVVMMSLPDPSLEEDAIPPFLRPLVATVKSLVASPPLLKALFRVIRRPAVVRRWVKLAYASPEAVNDELVEILVSPAQDKGAGQAFATIIRAITGPQFGPRVKTLLPTIEIPMLLIWGRQDRMVPPGFAQQFADYNPHYLQLLMLDSAGHCPHDECPEQVNGAILDWIVTWHGNPAMQ